MINLGLLLKNARENRNLTQREVMELTGIHRKSLSGYENNVSEPDLCTFAALLSLYGLSADEVLNLTPGKSPGAPSRQERKLLSLFRSLDDRHKKEILIQLSALAKYLRQP